MKLLVFSDAHGEEENARRAAQAARAAGVDAVVCCGDITTLGTRAQARRILSFFSFAPVLAVPGNMDTLEILTLLEDEGVSLHAAQKTLHGTRFAGFGGGLLGGAGLCNFGEPDIRDALARVHEAGVLVTHLPPQDTQRARAASGDDLGSRAVREALERLRPRLHCCGHVHEARGVETADRTLVLNPGPLQQGFYALASLEERVQARFERV